MLATTCLNRSITISGKRYLLAPPSVRQAVQILHVLKNMEDQSDAELLVELITQLSFTPSLKPRVIRKAVLASPKRLSRMIGKAITQGYDPKRIQQEMQNDKDQQARQAQSEASEVDWAYLISEYSYTYQIDPFKVWENTPFAMFMVMLTEARKQQARGKLDMATVVSVGFGGDKDKKITETWTRQAGGPSQNERKAEKYKATTNRSDLEKERNKIKDTLMKGGR